MSSQLNVRYMPCPTYSIFQQQSVQTNQSCRHCELLSKMYNRKAAATILKHVRATTTELKLTWPRLALSRTSTRTV